MTYILSFLRYPLTLCLYLTLHILTAQVPVDFYRYQRTGQLKSDLTRKRSMVVISTPQKDKSWKETAAYAHKSFRVMGIDAINYIHYLDFQANPTVRRSFEKYADHRRVDFLILIHRSDREAHLTIIDRKAQVPKAWYTEGKDIREVIVNLAIALKRTDHENQNFLIPLLPEYLAHLPLYEGHRYPNYPDRIKRLKMAVFEIPEIVADSSLSQEQIRAIATYNNEVRKKNRIIRAVKERYPYKLDILPMQEEKELYQQGYQYVLYFLHSSAGSIRQILDYDTQDQTEYVSQLTLADGQRTLKTYAAEETVYKWYIKQTVVSDIHVGRYWDVHEDFETSLQSFIYRITRTLGK